MASTPIRIILAGDLCPIRRNLKPFLTGAVEQLFPDHLDRFRASDLFVVNLECPLTDSSIAIEKVGPAMRISVSAASTLPEMGVDVVGLANNHAFDYGAQGLADTMRVLDAAGVGHFGAGETVEKARHPFIVERRGRRIGLLGIAANEFSIAGSTTPGANPIDLYTLPLQIPRLRREVDYLIVLIHAGLSYYPYPSPDLQALARLLAELGVNLVLCQHSHEIGCAEHYHDAEILYGQGNFLHDIERPERDRWNTGLLVEVELDPDDLNTSVKYVPFRQSAHEAGVHDIPDSAAEAVLRAFEERSQEIKRRDRVEELWRAECNRLADSYFSQIISTNRVFRRLNRYLRVQRFIFQGRRRRLLHNLVTCEDHAEVLRTITQ